MKGITPKVKVVMNCEISRNVCSFKYLGRCFSMEDVEMRMGEGVEIICTNLDKNTRYFLNALILKYLGPKVPVFWCMGTCTNLADILNQIRTPYHIIMFNDWSDVGIENKLLELNIFTCKGLRQMSFTMMHFTRNYTNMIWKR